MDTKRVAYVTCRYPPMRTSGTYRVQAVLEHLPQHGYEILTVSLPERLARMKSTREIASRQAEDTSVLRPSTPWDPAVDFIMKVPYVRRLYRELMLPDVLAPWAVSAARRAARDLEDVDVVYATSPPYGAMLLGDRLARELDVPLVQEFRDPPSFDRVIKSRSKSFQRRMREFERHHLRRADAVIALTPTMRERFIELHPALSPDRVHVVTNGYPDLEPRPEGVDRDYDVFTLAYTGTFLHGVRDKKDGPFNPAVITPYLTDLDGPSELRVAGPQSPRQRKALLRFNATTVRLLGEIPRLDAVSEIAAADVALVVADDDDWWIGRKVFEYLAYAKRILAVLPPGDAADLLMDSPKATVVPLGDDDALREALGALYRDWADGEPIPSGSVTVPSDESSVAGIAAVLDQVLGH